MKDNEVHKVALQLYERPCKINEKLWGLLFVSTCFTIMTNYFCIFWNVTQDCHKLSIVNE